MTVPSHADAITDPVPSPAPAVGKVKVACLQVSAGPDPAANLETLLPMIRQARDAGAEFILTPENVVMIEPRRGPKFAKAEDEAHPAILPALAEAARETGAWLLAGSLAVKVPGEDRLANRSYLFDPTGGIIARYDKIHMFDVQLANGESYKESNQFRPGNKAVVADTPFGRIGMTICYDLRFGQLYRALAQAGAGILTVPSAFTVPTGQAHWHTLLKARAIENGCFVLAPAQTGTHAEGRATYGHSLIVAPWGEVLADGGGEVGIVMAELDLAEIAKARAMVPSLTHDRDWSHPILGMEAPNKPIYG
ncbi:MAG TPA: carbon-nitrogen hydrolase family protein [Stellaceae bacterium]|nr:carbon-nitrogen hydrolase family protein [Stellaceae bacterium]